MKQKVIVETELVIDYSNKLMLKQAIRSLEREKLHLDKMSTSVHGSYSIKSIKTVSVKQQLTNKEE